MIENDIKKSLDNLREVLISLQRKNIVETFDFTVNENNEPSLQVKITDEFRTFIERNNFDMSKINSFEDFLKFKDSFTMQQGNNYTVH